MLTAFHLSLVLGALTGIASAAVVDLHAFLGWKNFSDVHTWDWKIALLRWAQGAVSGALVGAGLGAYL